MSTQNPRVCGSKCDPCGSEKVTNPHGGSPLCAAVPLPCDAPPALAPAGSPAAATAPLDEARAAASQTGRALASMFGARATSVRCSGRDAARATSAIGARVAAATGRGVTLGCGAGVAVGRGVARSVTRMTRALDTVSRGATCELPGGIVPATISCNAIEIANATISRRFAAVPKKTPSRS